MKKGFKDESETINYIICEYAFVILNEIEKKIIENNRKLYKEHPEEFVDLDEI